MKTKSKKRSIHQIKIIIEKHGDYYIGYPLGLKGGCVGQGDTFEAVLKDTFSAVRSHVACIGADVIDDMDAPVTEVFVAETSVAV